MGGISQGARDGGANMYRIYGQIFAPAISALPPSLAVVCRGAMDGKEWRMPGCTGRYLLQAISALPPSVVVV